MLVNVKAATSFAAVRIPGSHCLFRALPIRRHYNPKGIECPCRVAGKNLRTHTTLASICFLRISWHANLIGNCIPEEWHPTSSGHGGTMKRTTLTLNLV